MLTTTPLCHHNKINFAWFSFCLVFVNVDHNYIFIWIFFTFFFLNILNVWNDHTHTHVGLVFMIHWSGFSLIVTAVCTCVFLVNTASFLSNEFRISVSELFVLSLLIIDISKQNKPSTERIKFHSDSDSANWLTGPEKIVDIYYKFLTLFTKRTLKIWRI